MTYVLNTEWSNQSVADRACRSQGSVLVTYYTVREQVRRATQAGRAGDRQHCQHASGGSM
jgi:hypothetical protein